MDIMSLISRGSAPAAPSGEMWLAGVVEGQDRALAHVEASSRRDPGRRRGDHAVARPIGLLPQGRRSAGRSCQRRRRVGLIPDGSSSVTIKERDGVQGLVLTFLTAQSID